MQSTQQNIVTERSFEAEGSYADPFNDIDLCVEFIEPDGTTRVIPAFWAGGKTWKVRYASPQVGQHSYRTRCTDASDTGLHNLTGTITIESYTGDNPLFRHGPLQISDDQRHLQHLDGTPFFWLGDTWWMGLCDRLDWPQGFARLTADRVEKGFTLIQIVAGLYPDMGHGDERGRNEAGLAWESDWSTIRPSYFDMADRRIAHLVDHGLLPCIVGCWGYYMEFAGPEVLKKHWRYLVARWGAYPMIWCVSGETLMLWYQDRFEHEQQREALIAELRAQWMDVTAYLRSIDPWHRLVTAHPGGRGSREMLSDELVDIEMLQTGHGGHNSLPNTVNQITESVAMSPAMPVINGEVSYEGIGGSCWQDVQRLMFWTCMLSGAAGHTYGANGLWQMGSASKPYGPSPHGMAWGDTAWPVAAELAGSRELGLGRRILESYDWHRLTPTPDIVEPRWSEDDYFEPYAATIAEQCIIVYLPKPVGKATVKLQPNITFHACFIHPATGERYDLGDAQADEQGTWTWPGTRPIYHDLLLVLQFA